MSKYLEKLEKEHRADLSSSQQNGNETFRELNVQLIFIAAAIISFSLLIFLNGDITNQLNGCEKYLLISIWILLGLSVLFGIIQFFVDYKFFKKHFKLEEFLVETMRSDNKIKQIKEDLNIYTEEQEKEMNEAIEDQVDKMVFGKITEEAAKKHPKVLSMSSEICIIIQVFLLISSLGLLIYFMATLLF
jgi:hypothetical protein